MEGTASRGWSWGREGATPEPGGLCRTWAWGFSETQEALPVAHRASPDLSREIKSLHRLPDQRRLYQPLLSKELGNVTAPDAPDTGRHKADAGGGPFSPPPSPPYRSASGQHGPLASQGRGKPFTRQPRCPLLHSPHVSFPSSHTWIGRALNKPSLLRSWWPTCPVGAQRSAHPVGRTEKQGPQADLPA